MHSNTIIYTVIGLGLGLGLGLAPLAARADLQLDAEDVPAACGAVCRPVVELSRTCDVVDDDDASLDDQTEGRLTLQCLCINNSFDVSAVTALCASCMQQNETPNTDDDDDDDDINEIMNRCGFQSTSYTAAQSTAADGIFVAATRPSSADQLTTTIGSGGVGGATTTITPTPTTATTPATGTGTGTGAAAATTTPVTFAAAPALEPRAGLLGWLAAYLVGAAVLRV